MQSATSSQLGLAHRSGSLQDSLSGKVILTIAASAFVALCAHISLPLPFTPVPLTLQNFAVILIGMRYSIVGENAPRTSRNDYSSVPDLERPIVLSPQNLIACLSQPRCKHISRIISRRFCHL